MKNTLIINAIPTHLPIDYSIDFIDNAFPTIIKIEWIFISGIYGLEESEHFFIKPNGTYIDPELLDGISFNKLIEIGVHIELVLEKLYGILPEIEFIVGFNIEFIIKLLKSEFYRNGYDVVSFEMKKICLMKIGANLCKIPSKFGNTFKYPTYTELYNFINRTDIKNTRVSKNDLKEIFYLLIEKKLLKEFNIYPNPKHIGFYKIIFDRENISQIKFEKKENDLFEIKFNEKTIFSDISEYSFYKHIGLITIKKKYDKYYESSLFDLNGRIHNTLVNAEIYLDSEEWNEYYWATSNFDLVDKIIHQADILFFKFKYAEVYDYNKGSIIIGEELCWKYSVKINNARKYNLINLYTNELFLSILDNEIIYENERPNIIYFTAFKDDERYYFYFDKKEKEISILDDNNEVFKKLSLETYTLENVIFSYGILKSEELYGIYDFFNEKFIIEPIYKKIKVKEKNKKLDLKNFVLKNETNTISFFVKNKEVLKLIEQ